MGRPRSHCTRGARPVNRFTRDSRPLTCEVIDRPLRATYSCSSRRNIPHDIRRESRQPVRGGLEQPDPSRRRQAIAALWTEDGAHFTPSLEARGHEAIEARITGAHDRFVRTEGYGFHFFVLGADGRIRRDYQFAEPLPSA
jgi:hypothetical protein